MSDETTGPEPEGTAGEETEQPSRVAGVFVLLVLAGVAVLVLKVIVTVAPYTAYFVAGILACLGWQKVRAWAKTRRAPVDGDEDDEEEPDVMEALQHLGRNGDSVLLTQLRKRLRVTDTKAVKKLLKADGIRWRDGVRTPAGNGPGVHHEDIPAPPPREAAPSESGCSCSSGPTTATPTTASEERGEGLRVEPIGQAGAIIRDPADTVRHHRVK